MIEELKKLEESLTIKKGEIISNLSTHIAILKSCEIAATSVINKIKDAISIHKNEKDTVEADVIKAQKTLSDINAAQLKTVSDHTASVSTLQKTQQTISTDIDSKEQHRDSLNKVITGLMSEFRGVEEQLVGIRGQLSASTRNVNELKDKELVLTKSIEEKTAKDTELTTNLSTKQIQYSKLLQDIAILEARNK